LYALSSVFGENLLLFTNNLSERSLKGVKSKMKVAGHFQNLERARFYARIKTYVESCYRHGIDSVTALNRLMRGSLISCGVTGKEGVNKRI
jgi:transposase